MYSEPKLSYYRMLHTHLSWVEQIHRTVLNAALNVGFDELQILFERTLALSSLIEPINEGLNIFLLVVK